MALATLADVDLSGHRVLVRVDFNVPLANGQITSDRRILQALPTLRSLLALDGCRLVLMSHLGRPAGQGFEPELSLAPVAARLSELLERPVVLGPPEVVGPDALAAAEALPVGGVMLLENVRFVAAETVADKARKSADGQLNEVQRLSLERFVAALAQLGDAYVNDAFGTCHRQHASMYGLPALLKERGNPAVAGLLVEKEVRFLGGAITEPKRPFVAVLGGAKVSDKVKLIEQLLPKVDRVLVGGAMAYTLLLARGVPVGRSRVEMDLVEPMRELLRRAGERIVLPVDHVVTSDLTSGAAEVVDHASIADDRLGVDIGPKTRALFAEAVVGAGTVVWNGPMGVFETPRFAEGTFAMAQALVEATARGATTIVGGGDSAAAIEAAGLDQAVTHVSTGGGASLEFLEGHTMPPLQLLGA